VKADSHGPGTQLGRDVAHRRSGGPDVAVESQESLGFFASLLGRLRARMVPGDEDRAQPAEWQQTEPPAQPVPPPGPIAAPVPALRPATTPVNHGRELTKATDAVAPQAAVGAVALGVNDSELVQRLTTSIGDFCSDPATQGREGWTVRLELNQDLLPMTELEMNLSPQWLLLRFLPRDPTSRALVSSQSDSLQASLLNVINPKRDVIVSVE
jgi:hypothetical protein